MPILTPEERLGQHIADRYQLDTLLSSGGMGVLFRASDRSTGEQVAVKMLKPAHTLNADHIARFMRETRIASEIRHPNIARVLDIGTDAGVPFMVMELLQGRSLAQELDQRITLPFAEVLQIAVPIASALAAAHVLGTVHRDIKPSNIFLCADPNTDTVVAKLLDFGIAKRVQDDFQTDTGFLIGTPGYMAPEHAQYGECSPYTDIWGLGAVIYSCLTGHPPHACGSVHEMLGKLVREAVPPLEVAGVGRRASAIIDRALAREPQARYPSMAAFGHALDALASGDSCEPVQTIAFDAVDVAQVRGEPAPSGTAGESAHESARNLPLEVERTRNAALSGTAPALRGGASLRKRMPTIAFACLAGGLLLSLAFAPVDAKLWAAGSGTAPALRGGASIMPSAPAGAARPLATQLRGESALVLSSSGLDTEAAMDARAISKSRAALSGTAPALRGGASLVNVTDTAGNSIARDVALAPASSDQARALPSARRHRLLASARRDGSERGAAVQRSSVSAPDPMDRRR